MKQVNIIQVGLIVLFLMLPFASAIEDISYSFENDTVGTYTPIDSLTGYLSLINSSSLRVDITVSNTTSNNGNKSLRLDDFNYSTGFASAKIYPTKNIVKGSTTIWFNLTNINSSTNPDWDYFQNSIGSVMGYYYYSTRYNSTYNMLKYRNSTTYILLGYYTLNNWHNLTTVFNSVNFTMDTYLDGIYLNSGIYINNVTELNHVSVGTRAYSNCSLFLDNISFYDDSLPNLPETTRKFPYPYVSAMSISSDIDSMDTNETYDALDYLNTNHSVNGTDSGVDLEVSQNFWMNGGSASGAIDTLCYYSDNTLETTLLCDKSNIFLDYLNMGYFDAPHTMSPNNVDMATNLSWYLDAISVLNQSSHPITYWVDHSEVPQNIGIYNNNFVGDNPENSAHYHWNRTKTSLPNLVYFWENSPVVSYKFYPGISNPLYFATLNDSSLIYGFWRNQGRCSKGKQCIDPYPNSAYNRNLSKQITDLILNNLIQHNLYSIIPSHFGSSGNTSTNTFRTIFDSNTTTQLHTLADYNKGTNGKNKSIYVTTTGKLLRYAEVSTFLNYTYDGSKITINSVNSTIRNFTPTVDDLEGITFNVPITTSVFIGTTNVTSFIVPNPADSSGQVSIMFPLKRLTYPYPKISKVGSYSIDSAGVVTWNRNSQRPSINQAINISLIPSSDSVNITVSIWNTTGDYRKVWNESSSNHSVTTQHTIGDFPIHTNVIVLKNGATYGNFPSNSTGAITFIYSDGYSEIQFYASESNQKSLPNPSNGVILTIAISSALYGYYLWRKRHM